ncbi:hypothetical protein CVIRNUC_004101 [Coccomyxa viridis]|uniref:CRAL-TRIO domain-containing protein n=1 Tax=Coccomyxa viridis TaxID=1274662 RepID=A0AAV1I238_9CHLO|nr:hypothetical protein CVIRNUC_004101 [Coccomyxa viridis]
MADELVGERCSNPFGCWLSSAPVQLSLDFGFGVRVGATVHLPIKRYRRCKGDVPTPPASTVSTAAASGEQVGGLAWELQKRIESRGDVRGQLQRGAEPLDPDFYARWLKSKGSVDEAEACIRAHAEWREAFVTRGRIHEDEIVRELAAEKAFLQGCDKEGHPVLVVWAARHDMGNRTIEETKRFICYCLDNTIAAADTSRNPRGQILCLFDLSGLRTRNLDVKALQAVFELLQSHYPERLHALWFLNAPFIFWGVWRMVRPFIRTEETKSKIVFLSGSDRAAALHEHIPPQVLPEVYGGDSALVPVEEAALKRLAQQRHKQLKKADKKKPAAAVGPKSSRIASAGRVIHRWSGSAWGVAKKPAVAAWHRLPHWQHKPRLRFWHPAAPGAPSRTGTLSRTLSRHFSLRRPAFTRRPRAPRPPSQNRGRLRMMLSPAFLLEIFRLLTVSAAQALYWAWSHAIPLRLQRPAGDSSRLPTAAPVGSPSKTAAVAGPGLCSSLASPSTEAATIPVSAPCSSGSERDVGSSSTESDHDVNEQRRIRFQAVERLSLIFRAVLGSRPAATARICAMSAASLR